MMVTILCRWLAREPRGVGDRVVGLCRVGVFSAMKVTYRQE